MKPSVKRSYPELVSQFLTKLPARLENIWDQFHLVDVRFWRADQVTEIHRLIHSITGAAGTFGKQGISDAARLVEHQLKILIERPEAPSVLEWSSVEAGLKLLGQVAADGVKSSGAAKRIPLAPHFHLSPLIYLVEDDLEQANALSQALQDDDYRVNVFTSPHELRMEFAALVSNAGEFPAAVLMDMILPGGLYAGVELIDELGLHTEHKIPILLLSVRDDLPARLAALRAGACRYMTKPVQVKHLIDQLDAITCRQPREPYRILLIDDDEMLLEALATILRAAGMVVRALSEPLQLIEALDECDPDLVVLDVYMPGASGPELAAVLRERDGQVQLPILFLSSEADLSTQLAALNLGGDDFLMKPVQPQHLVAAVAARIRRARQNKMIRQRLEKNLYERECEHQALNHHAIVSLSDQTGTITYVNNKFCEISGYSRDQLLGEHYRIIKSNQHSPEFYQGLWQTISSGKAWQGDICNKRKDGSLYWVAETITSFLDHDGKPYQFASIATDITHVKVAEAALRVSEERNLQLQLKQNATEKQELLDRVTDAFVALDKNWNFTYINKAAGLMFKRDPAPLIGKHIWTEFPKPLELTFRKLYYDAMADQKPTFIEAYHPSIERWIENRIYPSLEGLSLYFQDITTRKEAEEKIEHLAYFDALTELPNRRLFLDRLRQVLAATSRNLTHGALIYIDLDQFKTLNDTLGHDQGDIYLQEMARRLCENLRAGDTVARFGADEFVIILPELALDAIESARLAEATGEKILGILKQSVDLGGQAHFGTASIGIALFGEPGITVDDLLKWADLAMHQAKTKKGNTLRFFDPKMQEIINSRVKMERDLHRAILQQQFVLFYQVQINERGQATGAETLIRWIHPIEGVIAPAEFIPLAEETGLILAIGHWVLESACKQLVAWSQQSTMAHLSLAVNVSVRQFRLPDFVEQVLTLIENVGADPSKLKLELTESMLLDDVEDMISKMTALRAHGVKFSLDDFGTGYSSLNYLKRLPLDQLKIDQSFVRYVLTDANDAAIARTIVALGQSLGLEVIAEGVETTGQRNFLAEIGCCFYQGYLFSKPVPIDEFNRLVHQSKETQF